MLFPRSQLRSFKLSEWFPISLRKKSKLLVWLSRVTQDQLAPPTLSSTMHLQLPPLQEGGGQHGKTRLQFGSVQSLSRVQLFATPWTAAHQASLSITNSQSPPKPMSIESVMPSNHLILCRPLLLLPSIFLSIRVFSNAQLFAAGGQRHGLGAIVVKVRTEGQRQCWGVRLQICLRGTLTGLAEGLSVGSGFVSPWFLQVVKFC